MELSKRTLRWIENMGSDIDFDLEKKIATVPLYYETPDDLLNVRRSRPGKPVISRDALNSLLDTIKEIPKEFTAEFSLIIDDYGEYDHHQLLEAIQKIIENTYYYYDEDKKKDNVLAVILLIIGVLTLCFQVIGGFYGFLGTEGAISTDIIDYMLDSLSCVFIWEAGAVSFLNYGNDSTLFHKELRRIHGIRFAAATGEVLSSVDKATVCKKWVSVGKGERIARNFILFTYPLIIALTVTEIGESASQLENLDIGYVFSYAFTWAMVVLLSISSISFYRGKGPLRKWTLPLSLIAFAYMVVSFIGWFVSGDIHNVFFYLDSIGTILLLINIICLIYMRKQNVDVRKKNDA